MLNSNAWYRITVCKQMSSDSFKNEVTYNKLFIKNGYAIK